jgi:DNA-binding FadR family transcriptional regulator
VVRNPAYLQVAEQLRDAILDGRFAPGDELPTERALSTEFSVSRTTIREALRVLEAQGLIMTRAAPFRPVVSDFVAPLAGVFEFMLRLGRVTTFDLVQYRGMLELEAIDRSVLERDAERWADARAALGRMHDSAHSVEPFLAAYNEFHRALVRAGGNDVLFLTMDAAQDALQDHLHDAFARIMSQYDGTNALERTVREHVELLQALEACDGPRARLVLRDHMNRFYTELLGTSTPVADAP